MGPREAFGCLQRSCMHPAQPLSTPLISISDLERPHLYPESGRSLLPSFLVDFDQPIFRHDIPVTYLFNRPKDHTARPLWTRKTLDAMADHTRQLQEPELIDDGLSSSKTPRTADQRLAGPLSRITSDLFRGILQHPDRLPSTAYRRVEREYGYFQLWCDGYGVLSGALDCDLVASKRLRLMTYRRISEVCQALISSRFYLHPRVRRN